MRRDASEFEALVLAHAASLLRFARKLTGSSAQAEELVQMALLSAWQRFAEHERGANRHVWLFRVLLSVRNREFRRTCSRPRRSGTGVIELISAQTAFSLLSEEHRQALLLAIVEGFTVNEISRVLDIPSGSVMLRLGRARTKLQVILSRRHAGGFR